MASLPLSSRKAPSAVLTIAGSDPSGGAGIQADLKTFTALGCYGTSVVTALTAQNTTGVQGVHECPPEFVQQQLQVVLDDIPVLAMKTGMLSSALTIRILVQALTAIPADKRVPLVVDPVMISTSGHTLLEESAIDVIRTELLPISTLVTPNIPEAELILGGATKITTVQQMKDAAAQICSQFGTKGVLLKGGHLKFNFKDLESTESSSRVEYADVCDPTYPHILRNDGQLYSGNLVVDVLFDPSTTETTVFVRPRLDTQSTHGTGCTLSAALVCELAKGLSLLQATRIATEYTHTGIATASPLGAGHGPLNHMHPLTPRLIAQPTAESPYPFVSKLIHLSQETWSGYVRHPFVEQLGKGTLCRESFVHFIKQDYHYLIHYARAHGLLAAKSTTFAAIQSAAQIMQHIALESTMHQSFCELWGVTPEELLSTSESAACTAYALYIMDVGLKSDDLGLIVALSACLLGYGEVGLWLAAEAKREGSGVYVQGNPYEKWITDYSGELYQAACRTGLLALEARVMQDPPSPAKYREYAGIWASCVQLEKGFWDMAIDLS